MRKLIAVLMACMVALSTLTVSVTATDYQSQYNFWNWAYDHSWFLGKLITGAADNVCAVSEDSLHHSTNHSAGGLVDGEYTYSCICDYCGQTFTAVATNLQETYENETPDYTIDNTGAVTNFGEWRIDPSYSNIPMGSEIEMITETCIKAKIWGVSGYYPSFHLRYYFTVPTDTQIYLSGHFNVSKDNYQSVTGIRKNEWVFTGHNVSSSVRTPVTVSNDNDSVSDNPVYYFNSGNLTEYHLESTLQDNNSSAEVTWHYDVPLVRYYVSEVDITDAPISGGGSISYVDDNSNNEIIENQFFDQSTNTYHNPVTDTSSTVESWEYDYSTRTYTGHTENGDVFIQYGDENITVTEGNNIYHYYYTAPDGSGGNGGSGSSGGGSDNDGESIWDKLGELLGNLVGGLLDLISGVISGLLDSLIELVSVTLEKLGSIVDLFGSFGDALKSLWSWLPEDIVTILAAGVSVVVFASVIKLFI